MNGVVDMSSQWAMYYEHATLQHPIIKRIGK